MSINFQPFSVHENPDLSAAFFIDFIYLATFQFSIKKMNTMLAYVHNISIS